jgi:GST-like protein
LNWEKLTGQAVIPIGKQDGSPRPYTVFDPCIWKKDGVYYALSAGTLPDGPGGKPYSLFESGAILMYLAEKTEKFMPTETAARYQVIQWLMFQMGGIGPMFGQAHHFRQYAPEGLDLTYAKDRYTNEAGRLYCVLDRRLGEAEYLAGDYSIADMAVFPWTRPHDRQGHSFDEFPNVQRWFDAINARPAVVTALKVLADKRKPGFEKDAEAQRNLFGAAQYQRR